MTIHILSKSPQHAAYKSCLQHVGPQDIVMLINDGVYALKTTDAAVQELLDDNRLFALQHDATVRGVTANGASLIDEAGFVALTCEHSPSQSWF